MRAEEEERTGIKLLLFFSTTVKQKEKRATKRC